jgi:hypothetical protein
MRAPSPHPVRRWARRLAPLAIAGAGLVALAGPAHASPEDAGARYFDGSDGYQPMLAVYSDNGAYTFYYADGSISYWYDGEFYGEIP